MSNSTQNINPLFTSRIHYPVNFDGHCESNIPYDVNPSLVMDIYYPKSMKSCVPVVIFVTGYPDFGFEQMTGMKIKQVQQYISWAQLFAASGIAAITYKNVNPEKDIFTLLQYLDDNSTALGIDPNKVSIWSCSGNVPNALSVLAENTQVKCAAFLYGYAIDGFGSQAVELASKSFGFVHPGNEGILAKLPPVLVVRAGRDEMPGLNDSIDSFVSQCLRQNQPLTLLNLPNSNHAFDIVDNQGCTQQAIRTILGFFKDRLTF
ncbi:putative Esterase/lipase [Vibrio nigripulchritudo SFn27]|uniref:Putative Esterase/lipase n=1 Tax=Vibrio nigripulchritudo TaxID=28173 RepID=U4KC76_9VIBR|nr:alpha/beta hydrolase [Vibrio nigripulchritudo]CCN80881.1 putative Esterase/lipase [Vibrio nigripulchritudo BLFn1]CCN88002.1 putative Esterase/lipase [Vibrio nigripulchritudo SFn27]CCN96857.1 putative Esterase/lipase [Vibrio nigripulchritudo ENn2]CCO43490.1 putative Esterase/lipase [Vibrio nigripulchritudo SFn135]CCO51605.1 putative Esterase/lipase [Vibrio nigripulchritudo Wn13]